MDLVISIAAVVFTLIAVFGAVSSRRHRKRAEAAEARAVAARRETELINQRIRHLNNQRPRNRRREA